MVLGASMCVLTLSLLVAGCRGRAAPTTSAPVAPATAEPQRRFEFPPEMREPPPPTVVQGESETIETRSETESRTSVEVHVNSSEVVAPSRRCCRTCRAGKACGDTCITADRTCHVAPGCACDG